MNDSHTERFVPLSFLFYGNYSQSMQIASKIVANAMVSKNEKITTYCNKLLGFEKSTSIVV